MASRAHQREIESLAQWRKHLSQGVRSLRGWHIQSVDLRGEDLRRVGVSGAVFLGCLFADGVEDIVRQRGALVFPALPELPFDPYRARLYTPEDLYAGLDNGYSATLDAIAYAWSLAPRTLDRTLATALHDHAINDAVTDFAQQRSLVGVMGGHAVTRDCAAYAAAAELGHALARRHVVATGGGPGAMEAANLGAFFSAQPIEALRAACTRLAEVPDFHTDITAWAQSALKVRHELGVGVPSLGIPTWHYGDEPPNLFADHIAKYFTNSIREQVLLDLSTAGIVVLPGSAGTLQEIFQSSCEKFYAGRDVSPMVLVGIEHWTRQLPAWPLLSSLFADLPGVVHLVDKVAEAAEIIAG